MVSLGVAGAAQAGGKVDREPVAVTTLASGVTSHGAPATPAGWWASDAAGYEALAKRLSAAPGFPEAAPDLAIPGDTVVAYSAGERSTGGFVVSIGAAWVEGAVLVVEVAVEEPPAGGMVIQMITHPFAAATVATPEGVVKVEFRDAQGDVLATATGSLAPPGGGAGVVTH